MTITEHIVHLQAIAAKNPNLVMCSEGMDGYQYIKIETLDGMYRVGHVERDANTFNNDNRLIECEPENASVLVVT